MEERLFTEDSEVAVLSILLNNPDLVFDLRDIKSFMFNSKPNSGILDTILSLASEGLVPDIKLVENKLNSENNLENLGGMGYLDYLKSQEYNCENLRQYELNIINAYKAKTLISLSSSIPGSITKSSDIDFTISKLRVALDELTINYGGNDTTLIRDLIQVSWDEILSRVDNPGLRGHSTGYKNIDLITTGINPGELWIIAGRPGMGKTALDCGMILNSAKTGVKSLFIELEMGKREIIDRFLAIDTNIPLTPNIRMGQLSKKELEQISNSLKIFKDLPIYLNTRPTTDLNYVESTIRKHKKLNDIDLVFIDYVQLLSLRGEDSTHELGRISRMAKLLATDLGIGVVINSQLNRNVESRDDKRPLMSDLRQSGNLEEDADLVIMLYRDEVYNTSDLHNKNKLEFIIRKNRSGPIGTIEMGFDAQTNRAWDT